jgi:hypothetical protein
MHRQKEIETFRGEGPGGRMTFEKIREDHSEVYFDTNRTVRQIFNDAGDMKNFAKEAVFGV